MLLRRHRLDRRNCQELEKKSIKKFLELAKEHGWIVTPATPSEDMNEHWDYKLYKCGHSFLVDLKSMKRINSQDIEASDRLLLVELQAVRNHSNTERPGWLYGKADYICFELFDSFLFIKREELLNFVEKTIDVTAVPIRSPQDKKHHIIYHRWDYEKNASRCDKFVYFKKEEIEQYKALVWSK